MEVLQQISPQTVLFFILYGITGIVPLIAALYLLLRRGNAIAPGVTPPLRLRCWASAFFVVASLGHVWWLLFYFYSRDMHSVAYLLVVALDFVGMVVTIAGTMLSMLQDRRRPIWPAFVAMLLFLVLGVLERLYPDGSFMDIAIAYNLVLYVLFFIYMVFAVRRYGRWLNDNYADLENKKVWLSQAVALAFVLLFVLYVLVDTNTNLIFLLHAVELLFFGLLLWRVETLPQLEDKTQTETQSAPLAHGKGAGEGTVDLDYMSGLLQQHCVAPQLYLQHDLSLHQLAHAIGTNRSYLSQYFSRQGITYNTYINNLRINHFISRYQELAAAGQPIVAQQLASESGYRSYSTFSLAFKQRTGQSVTAWMRD